MIPKTEKPGDADATIAPQAGWVLIARRQLRAGGKLYPRGARVPVEALGRNLDAMIRREFVGWSPPSKIGPVKVRDLPPAEPTKSRARVVIVDDRDPVVGWKRSLEATAQTCGGDFGRAADALLIDPRGCDLWRRRSLAEQQRKVGTVPRLPAMAR